MKNALFFFLYCDIILIDVLERHMFIGGLHMIHKKIGAFIFQDVQNPNETKTTAVTLRLYALILSVYFLVLFCVCCFLRDVPSSLLTLICSILYVFAFRITYLNHTHFASIFSQLLTLLWITVFYTEIWVGLRCTALPVCTSRIKFCSQFPPHTH